jgi:hypothetical protein
MPIHDWTRVDAGTFHDFHRSWTVEICRSLNAGLLPDAYFAMIDQRVSVPEPDIILMDSASTKQPPTRRGSETVAPPRLRQLGRTEIEASVYARKADRIVIRHRHGHVVALIEIVSPGNKQSVAALRSFVAKAVEFLQKDIHLLVVDLFPPTRRDPGGIHQAIWDEVADEPFAERPADKPLTVAAFEVADEFRAYVAPLAVGDVLPDGPLFLQPGLHVPTPLEATYQRSWAVMPAFLRQLVETPA